MLTATHVHSPLHSEITGLSLCSPGVLDISESLLIDEDSITRGEDCVVYILGAVALGLSGEDPVFVVLQSIDNLESNRNWVNCE